MAGIDNLHDEPPPIPLAADRIEARRPGPDVARWALVSNCHPDAPMLPIYDADERTITFRCLAHECGRDVFAVHVAQRPGLRLIAD